MNTAELLLFSALIVAAALTAEARPSTAPHLDWPALDLTHASWPARAWHSYLDALACGEGALQVCDGFPPPL